MANHEMCCFLLTRPQQTLLVLWRDATRRLVLEASTSSQCWHVRAPMIDDIVKQAMILLYNVAV